MEDSDRKLIVKRLTKIFDKKTSNLIENSILSFSEQYAETQGTPFLLPQIYQDKSDELLCHFENDKNSELIQSIKSKKIDPNTVATLSPQELNPEKYEKFKRKRFRRI